MNELNFEFEERLSKVINLLTLYHSENIFFMSMLKKVLSEEDQKIIDQCIKDYDLQYQSILSGMYSDKITTTH